MQPSHGHAGRQRQPDQEPSVGIFEAEERQPDQEPSASAKASSAGTRGRWKHEWKRAGQDRPRRRQQGRPGCGHAFNTLL
ncbi:MAG: hypothetical protein ACK56F_13385, partial [bacterium]